MGWGGGGHVNVPSTLYVKCSYAAEISGVVAKVCTRSVPATSYVIWCYAAEISGVVATVCARRGGVGWAGVRWGGMLTSTSYVICRYAAEISGVATVSKSDFIVFK